ncbi:ABC transporter permease [Pusillimonas noertemannii]|uniref:NitT/TauT family transport system permease protein/sulfonate transport system permease protein n=1 Tax=Pusillimonas noertemannii TaxID=305977 RepID=A0A2U1CL46_9BURK|nr:ABC transporter permease [Pusillimonas noertemannii]NYT69248.1 ABC transporter permease [Pusillimonas noertemannii]PVY61715.1 NitT/TauT family transport system permease protein/sulfonate transport system permease protein [Pusillimonas noertemannii]TFL09654.1 ABC transporter permease [Pusillimonas noertemannii]
MNNTIRRLAYGPWLGLGLILLILLLWEVSATLKWISPLSLPKVSDVAITLFELVKSGELPRELAASLWRMFVGYFIGVLLGIAVGLLMGAFRPAYKLLEPVTEILRPIPSPAYVPVAILFLGIDNEMKIFMVAFSAFFPVLLNTYSGVRGVDPVQLQTAGTFGVKGVRRLWEVVLPAAAPSIFTGMRISLAVALIVMVISEMVAASDGIGYFILAAQRGFKVQAMFAGIVTLAVVGYALNRVFLMIENRVLAWHHGAMQQSKN